MEQTDSLEMLPKPKKIADSSHGRSTRSHNLGSKKAKELSPDDQGYSSGPYSPMNGVNHVNVKIEPVVNLEMREPLIDGKWEEERRGGDGSSMVEGSPYPPSNVSFHFIMID